ncbi:30S ribosomal protein S5 [Candidatus Uhrbacteria bacterium]|nr:30S ribosomal protein S5 [Candidatus Uhrbacteria bacterium]
MAEKEKRPRRDRGSKSSMESEFEQRIIDITRVARVMAGGKRMRFRACVVIGDMKGKVGYGIGKGADVTLAVTKAVNKAKRDLLQLSKRDDATIVHEVRTKYKAARLLLKPAPKGTGIVAGGAVRSALEVSGIGNVVAKIYGSKNKINNIKALFVGFEHLIASSARYPAPIHAEETRKKE